MKKIFLLLLITGSISVSAQTEGFTNVDVIEKSKENDWFKTRYAAYEPDMIMVDSMRALPADRKVLVFAGLWCDDSKEMLPKFFKLSDQVNISRSDISLYLLDKNKHSAEGLEKQYGITHVPTIIVFKDNREMGRIVESVKSSVEKDLYDLMK